MNDAPIDSTPGWKPDPEGDHEYRWWDGSAWTNFVADDGVARAAPSRTGPAWRRNRTQDEWIDLGWKSSGCGCACLPVALLVSVPILAMSFGVYGDEEPGPTGTAIFTVLKVVYAIAFAISIAGGFAGLATLVGILDRRGQRRRRTSPGHR